MGIRAYKGQKRKISMQYAIILAGGTGSRTGFSQPKQFVTICGRPLIAHTIETFQQHPGIDAIICVCHRDHIDTMNSIITKYGFSKTKAVLHGGDTRQASVYNALSSFPFNADDIVLIHDAARPFVPDQSISEIIQQTLLHGSADLCVPATDTIIETDGNGHITGIPDRSRLMCVQTPQGFRYELLRRAHETAITNGTTAATDDIGLILSLGEIPAIVHGDPCNIKITTSRDFLIAEAIASARRNTNATL